MFRLAILTCVQGVCAGEFINLGFDWGSTCPWESKVLDDEARYPVVDREAIGRCSILRIDNDDGSQAAAEVSQAVEDYNVTSNRWIILTFDARADGDNDFDGGARLKVGTSSVFRAVALDDDWQTYSIAAYTAPATPDVTIAFSVCTSDDFVLEVDDVVITAQAQDPQLGSDQHPCFIGPALPVTLEDSGTIGCCVVNFLPGFPGVGFGEIPAILGRWNHEQCDVADVSGDGAINYADILLVLSNWGPCGGGPEPDDLEDVVDCMGLDWPGDWDDFESTLENGSSATQENEICWMEHYFEVHCEDACFCTPDCPSSDPWGGH